MEKIRLDKYLANMGVGSRAEVKKYIKQKKVLVDGELVADGDYKVEIGRQRVSVNGRNIEYKKYVYIMLNKPMGIVSATKDREYKTVVELIDKKYADMGVFPVGRLDKDTVGLVILTNDGDFAHETLSPKKHVYKKYFARVIGECPEDIEKVFKAGVTLGDGTRCKGAEIDIKNRGNEGLDVEITICEGKYHQIKRMFASVGMKVVYLKRLSFGEIVLDETLNDGGYRELNSKEMEFVNSVLDDRR